MPALSPLNSWRYDTKTGQNQHMIDDLPLLDYGLGMFMYHYTKDISTNPDADN